MAQNIRQVIKANNKRQATPTTQHVAAVHTPVII